MFQVALALGAIVALLVVIALLLRLLILSRNDAYSRGHSNGASQVYEDWEECEANCPKR